MNSVRKPYSTPELIVHGNIQEITQQNGEKFIDLPQGTPTPPGENDEGGS